ncbi:DEAD/DEAH box helicase [Kangiella koreensis]|uniref:ATP-dependent RNA helicase DeaD n=1 Tax=Kangiella koreensis (strain DSM 16069 / JCM 12317 / KCTC 12182 / SW-125) TaxID=523791 RepID=C7R855_KANKD|nr:DEAD/DEAH box helicase [Kangiella koreensis]ACV25837.1 DEAD/DEAH box helicase domain protein [Kangiella koreensis DSM 16069]
MTQDQTITSFDELGLSPAVLKSIKQVGYEQPSPIQSASIPVLMAGKDIIGQAQTGTGKTAAFALPMLSRLDAKDNNTQLLVLAPTRELAIQVAEACQSYAKNMPGLNVLPIYGGQKYDIQLRQLKRGAQIVVGTPGRVMDHIRRGTLKLDNLKALVLDEADEMLRMGFIDDVEWVLGHTPKTRQIALFSATMPKEIKKVAEKYLHEPEHIKIQTKTSTATTINQRYWLVSGIHKLDALTRVLETEEFDGMIIFVRTKIATTELADKLTARGFRAEALNGDIAQTTRERIVEKLKKGQIDILIATDVAARGLDVERISHVVNYDIPYDTESYVHRIGRTGRAGRSGNAILFVAHRERRMLKAIERATNQPITEMQMPSIDNINEQRMSRFERKVLSTIENDDLSFFKQFITKLEEKTDTDPQIIAAALAKLAGGDELILKELPKAKKERSERADRPERSDRRDRKGRDEGSKRSSDRSFSPYAQPLKSHPDIEMERFKIEAGHSHNVKVSNIVGAIANEAEIDSEYIGRIDIFDEFTTVDLPAGMPKEVLQILSKAYVAGRPMSLTVIGDQKASKGDSKFKGKDKGKPKSKAGKPKFKK